MSRFDYVRYDTTSEEQQDAAKKQVKELEGLILGICNYTPGRAAALALTKLEEVYMWIGKMIRDHQITQRGPAELQEERNNG